VLCYGFPNKGPACSAKDSLCNIMTTCLWDEDSLGNIMMAWIIMHNMILEDEFDEEDDVKYDHMGQKVIVSHDHAPELEAFIANYRKTKDNETHTLIYTILLVQCDLNYVV
jgi:hypothetical protein